ncbi:MAG: hypothetical protein AB7H96_08240 [Vicinamibacterales bacterium]
MRRDPFRDEPIFAMRDMTRIGEVTHDCFQDEIAIDFPSVEGLVDRVREAFLGEDAREHDGTVLRLRLSDREARRGAIVPLELPIRGTCRGCGGRGEVWTEPCVACCGSGDLLVRHAIRVSVPPGVADGARFRFRVSSPHAAPVRVELRVAIGA